MSSGAGAGPKWRLRQNTQAPKPWEGGGDSARRKCALFLGIKTGTYRARVVWMWLSPSHRCPWCSWGWCTRAAQTGGVGGQQWRGTPGPSALHTRPTLILHSSSFLLCPNNSIQVFAAKKIADPDPIELLNCMQKFFNFDFKKLKLKFYRFCLFIHVYIIQIRKS